VPASTAQFPGSFASDLRQDHRKYAEIRTFRSVSYTYFTDGWDEISVWKSAVSISQSKRRGFLKIAIDC
jgi:hypothetical protein